MSAKFGLRKLKEQKSSKKIDHPLAKYNSLGQLSCVVCGLQLKSDLLWIPHLQSKRHKETVAEFKAKGARPEISSSSKTKRKHETSNFEEETCKKSKASVSSEETQISDTSNNKLPADFFDNQPSTSQAVLTETSNSSKDSEEMKERIADGSNNISELLPEGFFDDAKLDAKVRKVEYIDKQEEEWEEFQKMIATETKVSENLQAEEEEEFKVEKDLTEYTALKQYLERVSKLKDRRRKMEELPKQPRDIDEEMKTESSSDSEEQLDDILNWRAKKA